MNTPQRRILRKMGYLRDQRGIARRYLTEQKNWDEHLKNTKDFILSCMERTQCSSATVLGTGFWLDIPVEEMLRRFSPLRFVDLSHPPEMEKRAEKYPGIILIRQDITGGVIEKLYHLAKGANKQKPRLTDALVQEGYRPEFDPGFVVSLNVMSQLDDLPIRFWKRYFHVGEEDQQQFRRKLQRQHLIFLQQQDYCLISDVSERKTYRNGQSAERKIIDLSWPQTGMTKQWQWIFDTSGSYETGAVTAMEVKAVCGIKTSGHEHS